MAVQYEGIRQEHVAVRTGAGLFDVSHMGQVETRGPDAEAFLQHVLSNDVTKIAEGGAQYSVLCREDGGVLDDLFTYRLGDGFLTVTNAANHDRDFAWFEAHAGSFDVVIADAAERHAMLALQGPDARAILASSSCPSRSPARASRDREMRSAPTRAPGSSRAAPSRRASSKGSAWATSRARRRPPERRSRSTSAASSAPPRSASVPCTAGRI